MSAYRFDLYPEIYQPSGTVNIWYFRHTVLYLCIINNERYERHIQDMVARCNEVFMFALDIMDNQYLALDVVYETIYVENLNKYYNHECQRHTSHDVPCSHTKLKHIKRHIRITPDNHLELNTERLLSIAQKSKQKTETERV